MPTKRTPKATEPVPAKPARRKAPVRRATDPDKAPRKAAVGKETKLSLTRLNAIANLLMAGNYIKTSCAFTGIGENTFHRWRMRGELEMDRLDSTGKNADLILEAFEGDDHAEPDSTGAPAKKASAEYMWRHRPAGFLAAEWPYVVFAFQVKRSTAAAEIRIINNIQKASATQWQAGAWWLERTRPDDYGRRDRLGLEGTTGEPIRTESKTAIVTVDELTTALDKALGGA